jgi:hypothetical protein
MIHFIMNDTQEFLLSLNGFCFQTRRKLFIWLLVLIMHFEFQFVFLVANIVFSNSRIHFSRILKVCIWKRLNLFFKHPQSRPRWNDIYFSINSQHIKIFDQYFCSLLIYNHTYMIMKIVRTNLMDHLILHNYKLTWKVYICVRFGIPHYSILEYFFSCVQN